MKFFIAFAFVVVAASALPTPQTVTEIGADNLTYNTTRFDGRNSGLAGFGAGTIGGAGGEVWTVWDPWSLRDALNSAVPRIVYIRGMIDLTLLFEGSPGVILHVGPFKSIIGTDANSGVTGGGFRLVNQVHVIFQNIKVLNALSYAQGEQPNGNGGIISQSPGPYGQVDGIDIDSSENVWVDHCELADDPWNAASLTDDQRRHNGLLTIKLGASKISISNNIFRNHNMNFLIGHDDGNAWQDIGRLKVTIYLNWFQCIQRNPRVRYGEVHVLNNLYTDIRDYGIGVGAGAIIYSEQNAFVNTRYSWMLASSASGDYLNVNNLLTNSGYENVPSNVNFRPSTHYGYTAMNAGNVEWHVKTYAGPK